MGARKWSKSGKTDRRRHRSHQEVFKLPLVIDILIDIDIDIVFDIQPQFFNRVTARRRQTLRLKSRWMSEFFSDLHSKKLRRAKERERVRKEETEREREGGFKRGVQRQ